MTFQILFFILLVIACPVALICMMHGGGGTNSSGASASVAQGGAFAFSNTMRPVFALQTLRAGMHELVGPRR